MNTHLREYSVDVREGARGGWVWKLGVLTLALLAVLAAARNWYFLESGMLGPDFGIIHQAYDFNLGRLPQLAGACAVFFGLLALLLPGARRRAVLFAALHLFLSFDLLALRYYVTRVEPEALEVRRIELQTPKVSAPLRLLHVSDIQSGSIGAYERKIFARIRELEPDLVINSGDYLQVVPPATFDEEFEELRALMQTLRPRYGQVGVFGDTDYQLYGLKPDEFAPLRILSSRSLDIAVEGGTLSLHGLSLYQSKNPQWAERGVERWINESSESAFRILVGHAPDFALGLADAPVDLCLAGHTHGGQVRLPWFGPLVIDSTVPKEWSRGFRRVGVPYLNVSAGAGSNRYGGLPPLRFNCPTEITVIDLVPLRPIR